MLYLAVLVARGFFETVVEVRAMGWELATSELVPWACPLVTVTVLS